MQNQIHPNSSDIHHLHKHANIKYDPEGIKITRKYIYIYIYIKQGFFCYIIRRYLRIKSRRNRLTGTSEVASNLSIVLVLIRYSKVPAPVKLQTSIFCWKEDLHQHLITAFYGLFPLCMVFVLLFMVSCYSTILVFWFLP